MAHGPWRPGSHASVVSRSWLTHLFSVDSHLRANFRLLGKIKVGFPNFVALSVRRDRSKPLGGWWGVTQGLFKIALQALPLGHLVQGLILT